jgi:hypothetical protein
MGQHIRESLEVSHLELLLRASTHGDLQAWATFQQSLEGTVLNWFHEHPGSEALSRLSRERHFVWLAFERLWQAVVQKQVACETLSEVLVYWRASLNGAFLEALRVSSHPGAILSLWPEGEGRLAGSAIWDRLQGLLPDRLERRLAYLLYRCGLQPAEIVRDSPQEWSDLQEVMRLRRSILARLM